MATANAATFDGTNDYLTVSSLSGIADSKLFTLVMWFKRSATQDVDQRLFHSTDSGIDVQFQTNNEIRIKTENSAGTQIGLRDTSSVTAQTWMCLMVGWDQGTDLHEIYLGDSDVDGLGGALPHTDDTIDFTKATYAIGANTGGGSKFPGDLSIIWFNDGQAVDFSSEANRRIFYSANGKVPTALANSSDGDVGSLGQPILFLNTAVPDYETNGGTGGNLTENGTLTSVTGPEIEPSNVLYRRRREVITAF